MTDIVYLVNRPRKFVIDPREAINKSQVRGGEICQRNPRLFSRRALAGHDRRTRLMRACGLAVLDIKFDNGPLGIFTRDAGGMIGGKFVLSRFRWPKRHGEEEGLRRLIRPEFLFEFSRSEEHTSELQS